MDDIGRMIIKKVFINWIYKSKKLGSQSKLAIHTANKHNPEHWVKKKSQKLALRGWGFSCVVEHLPKKDKASVPRSEKE